MMEPYRRKTGFGIRNSDVPNPESRFPNSDSGSAFSVGCIGGLEDGRRLILHRLGQFS